MMSRSRLTAVVAVLGLCLFLSGCGIKHDLYMPDQHSHHLVSGQDK